MTNTQIDFSKAHIISADTVNLKHIGPDAFYALSVLNPEAYNAWISYWGEHVWGDDHIKDNDAWDEIFNALNEFASTVNAWFGFSEHDGALLGFWPNSDDDSEY